MEFKNLNKKILKALNELGFEQMTPIQENSIPQILEGKDFIGISHTGTGKTCAFAAPILERIGEGSSAIEYVILCPTRELVIQTCEEFKKIGKYVEKLNIVPIYGGQSIDRQIMALKKKPNVIVATPGRLMDHMKRKTIKIDNLKLLVLDEADEMLNMGFREDLDFILSKFNKDIQTILFSATMSKDILNITKKYLKEDAIKYVVEHKQVEAPKISQFVIKTYEEKKTEVLTRVLDNEEISLSVIFCNTKRKVEQLVEDLRTRGYQCEGLHGDIKQSQRDIVMRKFRTGKTNILIATDVAARGIDVNNVEVVFNYDLPLEEEYYIHRIGRTARAGKTGKSITFVTNRDMQRLRSLERFIKQTLTDYDIPTNELVMNKKYERFFKEISNISLKSDLKNEIEIIEKYLEDNETSIAEFAASMLRYNVPEEKLEPIVIKDKSIVSPGRKRLFVTLGKIDGINKNMLRDYIVKTCDVNRSYIHDCEVLDKFSFLTVSNDVEKDIIKTLDGSKYNDRKICVEVSKNKRK